MFLLFLEVGLYCSKLPLSSVFTESHRCGGFVFSLTFVSMDIFISFFYFFSDLLVIQNLVVSLPVFVFFNGSFFPVVDI